MEKSIRQAAIIGINNYKDPTIPPLSGAVNDATEIYRILKEYGEFEIADNHFLTNENAKCISIRKVISDLLWKSEPCDLTLFYFSGHGFKDGSGNGYIAPHDMIKSEPIIYGIKMQELKELILNSKLKQSVLLILDCCYSGIPTANEKAMPEASSSLQDYFGQLSKETDGKGRFIFASSGEDQKSREDENEVNGKKTCHGIFTYHLIKGLDDGAADVQGYINLLSLRNYIEGKFLGQEKVPQFYEAGASQLDQILIATASGKRQKFIADSFIWIENWLNNRDDSTRVDPGSLIRAANQIGLILERSTANDKAKQLRDEIDLGLKEYWKLVNEWLTNDPCEIRISKYKLYNELDKLISKDIGYAEATKFDERNKKLFANLCDVSIGKIEIDTFIRRCEFVSQPGSKSTPSNKRYE
jgi:hypothetical protein